MDKNGDIGYIFWSRVIAVSYTHLTLPTKRIVYISEVAVSLEKGGGRGLGGGGGHSFGQRWPRFIFYGWAGTHFALFVFI